MKEILISDRDDALKHYAQDALTETLCGIVPTYISTVGHAPRKRCVVCVRERRRLEEVIRGR